MTLKIDGFKEVLDILKGLFSGIKSAAQIPENNRKEMKEALAATAELIDETLTILKQQITTSVSELKFGDKQKAKQMIYELGVAPIWEAKYRQFQLCDQLREATNNLEKKGLYKLINHVSLKDPDLVQQKMFDYIGGETNAAKSVSLMLDDLSQLANKVDTDFDQVVLLLEEARTEVSIWRQAFIDLEIEMRETIL